MVTDEVEAPVRQPTKAHDNGAVILKDARTKLIPREERIRRQRNKQALRDYGRGAAIVVKKVKDKKSRRVLKGLERKYTDAAIKAKDAEILLENETSFLEPETELERTYRVKQDEIQDAVTVSTAKKRFELKLDQFGPYVFDYSRTGADLLLGGRKGHVALMDWRSGKLKCELNLGETVRAVQPLHNNQYFAVAQKKHCYIYGQDGMDGILALPLPTCCKLNMCSFAWTMIRTLGLSGYLKWQDVSTGQLVAETPTKLGTPVSLTQNPWNAILHVGHQNGTVSLFSPNSTDPLVKLLCHKGPVRDIAVDREGRYMVSTGNDCKMAVWDIRMFKQVESYFTRAPATSVSISDTGLTAVGWNTNVTIWKDLFLKNRHDQEKVQSPYMRHGGDGKAVERVRWCPFEDTLGIGHDEGFSSIIVPGGGLANPDVLEVNPFETVKQRQESEVKGLLNKLQPEMIALDPNFIGNLDLRSEKQRRAERDLDAKPVDIKTEIRNRARGKNSTLQRYLRKQRSKNIIDERRMKVDEIWKEQQQQKHQKHEEKTAELGPALGRFARKE